MESSIVGGQEEGAENINNTFSCTNADNESQSTRKRNLTSIAWKHYKRQKIGKDITATCNYCGKVLKAKPKNGTKPPRTSK